MWWLKILPLLRRSWPFVLALAIAGGAFVAGIRFEQLRQDSKALGQAEATATAASKESTRQAELGRGFEESRQRREQAARVIIKEIVREVDRPVYRDCPAAPDSVVRNLNALRGYAAPDRAEPTDTLPPLP